jgi:hypothetical protein
LLKAWGPGNLAHVGLYAFGGLHLVLWFAGIVIVYKARAKLHFSFLN